MQAQGQLGAQAPSGTGRGGVRVVFLGGTHAATNHRGAHRPFRSRRASKPRRSCAVGGCRSRAQSRWSPMRLTSDPPPASRQLPHPRHRCAGLRPNPQPYPPTNPGKRRFDRSFAEVVREGLSPSHLSKATSTKLSDPSSAILHQQQSKCCGTQGCFGDGWQSMASGYRRQRTRLQPTAGSSSQHQDSLRRALYLTKVQGKCFNCFASDHRVAKCHNPTKCWVCQHFGHISYRCPSRQSSNHSSQDGTSPAGNSTSPNSGHNLRMQPRWSFYWGRWHHRWYTCQNQLMTPCCLRQGSHAIKSC